MGTIIRKEKGYFIRVVTNRSSIVHLGIYSNKLDAATELDKLSHETGTTYLVVFGERNFGDITNKSVNELPDTSNRI